MKGQWFIVSAVIATGVFLVISNLFKTYYVFDTSVTARANEDFHFRNINQTFFDIVAGSDCSDMDKNIREYRAFAEREMNNLGYRFFLNYTINDCTTKYATLGLLVGSSRMVVSYNVNPDDILK